jgi:hypothetical protein
MIQLFEEQGWDVDFHAGSEYNRTRTESEWKRTLNSELPEMPTEIYLQGVPDRMYPTIRQGAKPCFAFEILVAGRVSNNIVEQAFRTAFTNIKPSGGIYVGMFPYHNDEVNDNTEIVHRLLIGA